MKYCIFIIQQQYVTDYDTIRFYIYRKHQMLKKVILLRIFKYTIEHIYSANLKVRILS